MTPATPQRSSRDAVAGPFYTAAKVRELLGGVSQQTIDARVARHTLFALTTADGVRVFPTFQFDARDVPLVGLAELLDVLASSVDEWMLASWVSQPNPELGGQSPIGWLRTRPGDPRLLVVARSAAAAWEQ